MVWSSDTISGSKETEISKKFQNSNVVSYKEIIQIAVAQLQLSWNMRLIWSSIDWWIYVEGRAQAVNYDDNKQHESLKVIGKGHECFETT